jgi:hypothetical protein
MRGGTDSDFKGRKSQSAGKNKFPNLTGAKFYGHRKTIRALSLGE